MTFEFSLRKDETPETEPGVKIVILRLEAIMDMGERRVFGLEMSFFDFLNDKSGEGWMANPIRNVVCGILLAMGLEEDKVLEDLYKTLYKFWLTAKSDENKVNYTIMRKEE